MNIISALDAVLENVSKSELSEKFFKSSARELAFLNKELGLTDIQIVVLALIVNAGRPLSYGDMAKSLGISRLRMMSYTEEIEALVKEKLWLENRPIRHLADYCNGFDVAPGVVDALRHNKPYVPEDLGGMTNQMFIDRLVSHINIGIHNRSFTFNSDEDWLMKLARQNAELPLSRSVLHMTESNHTRSLLFFMVFDYVKCYGSGNEGLSMDNLDNYYADDFESATMREKLEHGDSELIKKGWLENRCEDGIADPTVFVLTKKAKDTFFVGYRMATPKAKKALGDRDLITWQSIASKELFYNDREGEQLERLRRMLSVEQLTKVQDRLKEKGMRIGVAVLFCGGPGTGKTETIRQLAREEHRDLMMVDISAVRSKFVGESEENTKAIFTRYKRLCAEAKQGGKPMPILFVNEADAVLGRRMEHAKHSADKMENTMQNILLQALEDLEGVMVCTTNLACSLDPAFERRFLVKIEFQKPDKDVRAKILRSMNPEMSEDDAAYIAERYDLSGGQIENVYRKATIDYVITGDAPDLACLCKYCDEETLNKAAKCRPVIGFGKAV